MNPRELFPFYQDFGQPCFQCFYGDWYPEQEMGNVSISLEDRRLPELEDMEDCEAHLAFPTFSDWLAFYLEHL